MSGVTSEKEWRTHQYTMMLQVAKLRGEFQMAPRKEAEDHDSTSISAWCRPLYHRKVTLNPAAEKLRKQVLYKPGSCKKRTPSTDVRHSALAPQ